MTCCAGVAGCTTTDRHARVGGNRRQAPGADPPPLTAPKLDGSARRFPGRTPFPHSDAVFEQVDCWFMRAVLAYSVEGTPSPTDYPTYLPTI